MKNARYRAWDTKLKKMLSPEELADRGVTMSVDGLGFLDCCGKCISELVPMQSIGLIDNEGNEIYDGDILHNMRYTDVSQESLDIVRWNDDIPGWNGFSNWHGEDPAEPYLRKVLGNIYENYDVVKKYDL